VTAVTTTEARKRGMLLGRWRREHDAVSAEAGRSCPLKGPARVTRPLT
jgi:hypothetical protein